MMTHYDIAASPRRIEALCEARPQPGDRLLFLDANMLVHRAEVDCPECQRRFDQLRRDTAMLAPKAVQIEPDGEILWA